MNPRDFLLVIFCLCWSIPVSGYEVETHGAITRDTYPRSVLVISDLLSELGLEEGDAPFGNSGNYYDVSGAEVHVRTIGSEYEEYKIKVLLTENPYSIKGWMMQGAIREDDVIENPCKPHPDNPLDDDYPNPPNRPLNHFYNPVDDRGLNQVIVNGAKATDWGLGVVDAFAQPPAEDSGRRNHYTLADAREALCRALTGRKNGVTLIDRNKTDSAGADTHACMRGET